MQGLETFLLVLAAALLFTMVGWYAKRTRTVTERQARMQKLIDDVVEETGGYAAIAAETQQLAPPMELVMAIERLRAEANKLCREADHG